MRSVPASILISGTTRWGLRGGVLSDSQLNVVDVALRSFTGHTHTQTAQGQRHVHNHGSPHIYLSKNWDRNWKKAYHQSNQKMTSLTHALGNAGNFRLFEGSSHSKSYALYRPTYPPEVYGAILDFCKKSRDFQFDLAIDVACGTGQSTRPLTAFFKRVVGTDVSPTQVEQAREQEDNRHGDNTVEYAVGKAEDLGDVASSSVDLITCAQSFHWFDQDQMQTEARRTLKLAGVLAVYGYGNCQLSSDSATHIVQKFFSETIGKYWPPEREMVNRKLSDTVLQLGEFTRRDDLEIHRHMPLSAFIGYLSSWSAYRALLKDQPESSALEDVRQELLEVYNSCEESKLEGGEIMIDVTWPVYILLARKQ